jgi:hypothetical protein
MQQFLRTHTARKEHTCDRCNGPIAAGQKYTRITDFKAGEVEVAKLHHPSEPCGKTKKRSRRREAISSLGRGWQSSK